MSVVPAFMPVMIPVLVSAVAFEILLLLHVPPVSACVSVTVAPAQTEEAPVIADIAGLTVAIEIL